MEGKRSNAVYCARTCKDKSSKRRAHAEGRVRSNADRYQREKKRRMEYAREVYWSNPDASRAYSREYRKKNPEKRAAQSINRRARKFNNPGYVEVTEKDWRDILRIHRHACVYCGRDDVPLERDHVIPLSRGGRHAPSNLAPACEFCNSSKNNLFVTEWKRRNGAYRSFCF